MNLKFRKLKIIIGIIIILIANFFVMQFDAGCLGFFKCYIDSLIEIWFIWIIVLICVYLIGSFLDGGENKK